MINKQHRIKEIRAARKYEPLNPNYRTEYSKEVFQDHYVITVKTANKNLIRKIELLALNERTKEATNEE